MEQKGTVFDISHYMTEDGPGIRTNVFLKGCPLSCLWCSNVYGLNPEPQMAYVEEKCIGCGRCATVCEQQAIHLAQKADTDFSSCISCMKCVDVCPAKARRCVGKQMTVSEVVKEVEKDRMFYRRGDGGVTLSGGEILMQAEFAIAILKDCKDRFINTAIETSAFGKYDDLKSLIDYCDTVFIDCKCISEERHIELTGVSNKLILENIQKAATDVLNADTRLIVRMPLIPGYNDMDAHLKEMADYVSNLPGKPLLNLLPYHNYGASKYAHFGKKYLLEGVNRPDSACLAHVRRILDETKITYTIGGYDI